MTPENFCYWLQGLFELEDVESPYGLSKQQTEKIKHHLQLVFRKETPIHKDENGYHSFQLDLKDPIIANYPPYSC